MILIRHGQSEFNVVFSRTRQDPGIRDPALTDEGRRQAAEAGEALRGAGLTALVTSPYRRALETAEIVARILGVPVEIDPVVGERAAYACDVGSPPGELAGRWPDWRFDHLADPWWPTLEESETALAQRCARFRAATDRLAHRPGLGVVSHWGFIRALTGLTVGNGTAVRFTVAPEPAATVVHPT